MKAHLKTLASDWPSVVLFVGIVLSLFLVPHALIHVRLVVATLMFVCAVWLVARALRGRWQQSKTTGVFVGYYLQLIGVALAIVFVWFLLMVIIERLL